MKLTKEQALKKIEELKEYVKKEDEKGFEIMNTDGEVIYVSKDDNLRGAVIEAMAATGWSVSNVSSDKTYDANSTTVDELADVLGSLLTELLSRAELYNARFYGKSGTQKLTKKQVPVFLKALGFIIED